AKKVCPHAWLHAEAWQTTAALLSHWLRRWLPPVQFGASFPMPLECFLPKSCELSLSAFALGTQNVTMAAHRVQELHGIIAIDLAPEPGNVNFDHVTEFFPVLIVEVLQQFAFGDHRARAMGEVFQNAIFHGHKGD